MKNPLLLNSQQQQTEEWSLYINNGKLFGFWIETINPHNAD